MAKVLVLGVIVLSVFAGCETPGKQKEDKQREKIQKIMEDAIEDARKITEEIIEDQEDNDFINLKEKIGEKNPVEGLIDVLKNDEDPLARAMAAEILPFMVETMEEKSAVPALIDALKDKTQTGWWAYGNPCRVCDAVIGALGNIGDKRAVEPLIETLKDKLNYTRENAADALKKITGQNFGKNYDKWMQWYEKSKRE